MDFIPTESRTHAIADYNITAMVGGLVPVQIQVAAEDGQSFFKYGRNVEKHKLKIDLAGGGHFSRSANKSGFLEFSVLHTSPVCGIFQAWDSVATGVDEVDNPGFVDFIITDNGLNPFLKAFRCKLEKVPDGERGGEIGLLNYRFIAVKLLLNEQGLLPDVV